MSNSSIPTLPFFLPQSLSKLLLRTSLCLSRLCLCPRCVSVCDPLALFSTVHNPSAPPLREQAGTQRYYPQKRFRHGKREFCSAKETATSVKNLHFHKFTMEKIDRQCHSCWGAAHSLDLFPPGLSLENLSHRALRKCKISYKDKKNS